ncbi:MAG: hypothetical protein ACQEQ4_06510 [Fibrobacterota bacterium]
MNITKNEASRSFSYDEFLDISIVNQSAVVDSLFSEVSECAGDSVFYRLYSNNVVLLSDVVNVYYLIKNFPETKNGIVQGMSREDVITTLGKPFKYNEQVLIYKCLDTVFYETEGGKDEYEGVFLYFNNDRLFAMKIIQMGTC